MAVLARIRMLGALQLQQGDRLITRFRYQKAAALLAYLAYYRQHSHTREQLIERFWPDLTPEAARGNLSNSLSSLRHQLEPPGTPSGTVLLADRLHVGLRSEVVSTDVSDFEERLKSADGSKSSMQQRQCLSDALNFYTGPLLPGFYEEWIVAEGRRLSDAFVQAARRLVRLLAKAGEGERALEVARRAVAVDPLREEAHRDLMQLYVAMGQPSAALGQYRELERILEQELGEAPSAATRRLVRDLQDRLATETPSTDGSAAAVAAREQRPAPTNEENATASTDRPVLLIKPPPSGTVTFLMLDWDKIDGRASVPAGEHGTGTQPAALLQRVASRNGGHLFQSIGESFGVVFSSATDALGGALAVLREIENGGREGEFAAVGENASQLSTSDSAVPGSAPRPRLALHSGDVVPQGASYSGPALQRAQRLVLAGHGGQLLCSETAAALLRRELEQGAQLLDLGLYGLGGVSEAERVWQVSVTGGCSEAFPALKATRGTPSHLPLQLTRFFGREAEIARLLSLLGRPTSSQGDDAPSPLRLVTLTGPGGMGKTRLALEVGTRLEEAWEGAIWFVPLADLANAATIPSAIISALGLSRSAMIEPLEQVITALNARPTLLILDNFEHLVEAGTQIVTTLLQRAPTLTCLVTSRQRLEIAGEHEVELAPLAVPTLRKEVGPSRTSGLATTSDPPVQAAIPTLYSTRLPSPELAPDFGTALLAYESVRLFVDRAQTVKPDFQLTANNAGAVATLCAGLEGIPLALELAASRAQVLAPSQMLEQMQDRFRFLVSRRRDTAVRHRTLLAAVEWSYRLLSPELQRVFARLSVFRGGWDLAAAEALCDDLAMEPLDALAQLRECSLVLTEEHGKEMRFRMLETLREFAAKQLTPEEREEIERRHAVYFHRWVSGLQFGSLTPAALFERLEEDLDNLRAVLAWSLQEKGENELGLLLAGDLYFFCLVRGHFSEGRSWLVRLLERASDALTTGLSKSLYGAGVLAARQGDLHAARPFMERCVKVAQALGEEDLMASAYNELGTIAYYQADHEQARLYYEKHLVLARGSGNCLLVASALGNLANLAQVTGDFTASFAFNKESLGLWREEGSRRGEAITLHNMANLSHATQQLAEAHAYYEQSLEIKRQLADRHSISFSLTGIARVEKDQGDYAAAAAHARESLALAREMNVQMNLVDILSFLIGLMQEIGEPKASVRMYGAIERIREEMNYPLQPVDRAEHEQAQAALRALLGMADYEALHAQGKTLSLEQALASLEETLASRSM